MKKISKKIRNLIILESIILLGIFCFIMYCQLVIDKNSIKGALKFAVSFMVPLIIYAIPTGLSYMFKGMIFTGEYKDPMLKDGKTKQITPSDANFVSANADFKM